MNPVRFSYSLGTYHDAVIIALSALSQNDIIARIWAKDYTVWKPAPDEIINRLGWLDTPADTLKKIQYIRSEIVPIINSGINEVVLLGMGGSSLAAEVFKDVFGSTADCPTLRIIDTTDPATIAAVTASLNPDKTLFIVSSKSGTTLEVNSLFQYFYNLLLKKSKTRVRGLFLFITDKGSPMAKLADEVSSLPAFLNNPDIGGRYSALSLPGIVPASLIGVDVEQLLQSAASAAQKEKNQKATSKLDDTGASLGAALGVLAQMGRDKLTLIMPESFASFGNWLEQLIAESTGKEGKGILPVTGEELNEPGAYGNDRAFVIFQNGAEDNSSKITSIIAAGHPVITVGIKDNYELGAQMFIWEMATAIAAHILKINPFDQPSVEATKNHTRRLIAAYREKKEMPQVKSTLTTEQCDIYGTITGKTPSDALKNFLSGAAVNDYVCLQVYLSQSAEIDEALTQLRQIIKVKYGIAATIGYGPRYLHSTGQLHKGDSGNGLFIQLTANDAIDVAIPDRIGEENSTLTFGALKAAQAAGDWQSLLDKGRRVIRFHFKTNPSASLKDIAKLL
jgi:glucose-6-phosphate isomerase